MNRPNDPLPSSRSEPGRAPGDRPWWHDPAEVDRLLDGECEAAERAARDADVARDAAAAARVEARRTFRAALAGARGAEARERGAHAPLEARVRSALAGDRRRRARRIPAWSWAVAAAAVLVVGLGLSRFGPSLRPADAAPPGALLAADVLRTSLESAPPGDGGATCGVHEPTSPFRLSLVARNEMKVRACLDESSESAGSAPERAVLYRVADLQTVGYVAMPDPDTKKGGAQPGPEIGVTRLEGYVVFDVRQGGAVYYLAVERDVVDRRGSCAACHSRSRESEKNPHRFRERLLPTTRP
jgi:hypothetical protein